MSSHHEWFLHYRPLAAPKRVYLGDEHHILAQGIGQVVISASLEDGSTNTGVIQNVLYVPDLNGNLLSVAQFDRNSYNVSFTDGKCCISNSDGNISAVGYIKENLYLLD
ncbi:hypothetical protein POSPLADRAFT_1144619, partial [Postia placenta MAD-698-R-SB12]